MLIDLSGKYINQRSHHVEDEAGNGAERGQYDRERKQGRPDEDPSDHEADHAVVELRIDQAMSMCRIHPVPQQN